VTIEIMRPDYRAPSQVGLLDHRIIWNVHPFAFEVHAIMSVFGVPIDIGKPDPVRIRAAFAAAGELA
jgi:hypothetical protein